MMDKIITLLSSNSFVKILLITVALDTILGVLRAIKEHKFNSCVGIDGAIRKAGMLLSVGFLMATDVIMHINVLSMWYLRSMYSFLVLTRWESANFSVCYLFYMNWSVF